MAHGHAIRRSGRWVAFLGSPDPTPANITPPTAAFTTSLGSDAATETLNASTSTAGSNPIASYSWNFGDGATGTGRTVSHTYAATSKNQVFNITLTVTDTAGYTGSTSHTVTIPAVVVPPPPSGTAIKNPWTLGTWDEGFPTGVTVYKASALAPAGWNGSLGTLISALPGDGIIDISGEQVIIDKWGSGNYAVGNSHFLGLTGGISNGAFNNSVKLQPNLLSAAQINSIITQNRNSTTAVRILITKGGLAGAVPGTNLYFYGVHLIGADQGTATEAPANGDWGGQIKTGPVRHGGMNVNLGGTGSVIQNCLIEGFGYSDGSTPPWEEGAVDMRRSQNFVIRRTEVSGILPVGSASRPSSSTTDPHGLNWQRSGGIQWNADEGFLMEDMSLHDTLVSGLTMSIASTSNAQTGGGTNNSRNFKGTRLYIDNNSQHGFSGINNEVVEGPVIYDHPTIHMNGTGGYHIKIANNTGFGELAPNIADYEVIEPTWSQTGNPRNGMFTIAISGWPSGNQTTAPKVTVGGKVLTPTTSTTADPANYYCIVKV